MGPDGYSDAKGGQFGRQTEINRELAAVARQNLLVVIPY